MTDREAIEYAENELESTGYTLETNNKLRGGLFKILSTKFEFFITAKSALQERDERSKGCKFCRAKLYFKTTQYARPLLAPLTEVQALGDKLLDLTGEVYVEINADFCPMCGRPLKGEDND